MKSSPVIRLSMAAGTYWMLMWGYMVLPSGQWFAAFLAIMMSIMLVFWVTEATEATQATIHSESAPDNDVSAEALAAAPSLEDSVLRLDSLKSELKAQYAQFGRDQSLLNSKSLGSWHRTRNPRTR